MDFGRWFQERTSRFERFMLKCVGVMLFLLLLTQALLTRPDFRSILSLVDRFEGTPVTQQEPDQPAISRPVVDNEQRYLRLSIINDADGTGIKVLVNGETVTAFADGSSVLVAVHDGDQVEVDSKVPTEDVVIAVTSVSEGIIAPIEGKQITFFGQPETVSFVSVGKVD
ncbi:MAG TPA: hypothetical protein VFC74_08345 [Oscillospiraceae bacterium]|nr:hypothetical protein [Oscillospiraceae bacterium]